jgi:hypothetical protein
MTNKKLNIEQCNPTNTEGELVCSGRIQYEAAGRNTGNTSIIIFTKLVLPVL